MKNSFSNDKIEQNHYQSSLITCKAERFTYCIFVFLTSGSLLVLSIVLYFYYQRDDYLEEIQHFSHLLKNWQSEPISELIKSEAVNTCPNGFSFLVAFTFPGTIAGCNCLSSTQSIYTQIYSKECNQQQLTAKCQQVSPIQSYQLHNWQANDGSQITLCGKRISGYNFIDSSTTSCSSSERLCGGDESQTKMCIPNEYSCPINFISSEVPPDIQYETIPINGTFSLYISRTSNNYMVSEFRTTQGGGICQDNVQQNFDESRIQHQLIAQKYQVCSVDSRFIRMADLPEQNFFEANQIQTLISQIPQNELISNNQFSIGLYYRSYNEFLMECRHLLPDVQSNYEFLDALFMWKLVVFMICLIDVVFIFLLLGSYFLFSKRPTGFHWSSVLSKCLFKIIQATIIVFLFYYAQSLNTLLTQILTKKCYGKDVDQQRVWEMLDSSLNSDMYQIKLAIFLIFLASVLTDLVLLFLFCRQKSRQSKLSQEQFNTNQWKSNNHSVILNKSKGNSPMNSHMHSQYNSQFNTNIKNNAQELQFLFNKNNNNQQLKTEDNMTNNLTTNQLNTSYQEQSIKDKQQKQLFSKPNNRQDSDFQPILPQDLQNQIEQNNINNDTQQDIQNIFGIMNGKQNAQDQKRQISPERLSPRYLSQLPQGNTSGTFQQNQVQQNEQIDQQQFNSVNSNEINSNQFATFGSEQSEKYKHQFASIIKSQQKEEEKCPSTPTIPSFEPNQQTQKYKNQQQPPTRQYSQKQKPENQLPIISEINEKNQHNIYNSPQKSIKLDQIELEQKPLNNQRDTNQIQADIEAQMDEEENDYYNFKLSNPIQQNQQYQQPTTSQSGSPNKNLNKKQKQQDQHDDKLKEVEQDLSSIMINQSHNQQNRVVSQDYFEDEDDEEDYELPQYKPQ